MHFKPSAGIFVSGLLLSILGTIFGFVGVMVASTGSYYDSGRSAGGGTLAFIGFVGSLIGVIMVYVGASRALKVIDALPAALNLVPSEFQQQLPRQQHAQQNYPQPQQPYVQPTTPQHLVYHGPGAEQQPPHAS